MSSPDVPVLRWDADGERVLCRRGDGEEIPVNLLWARPVSGRGGEVAIVDAKKKEIALLDSPAALDPASRAVAEEALARRYLIARVERVLATRAHMGTRYWTVLTDRGERRFALRDPARSVQRREDGALLLRDTMGNRYEIIAPERLDATSRANLERVL